MLPFPNVPFLLKFRYTKCPSRVTNVVETTRFLCVLFCRCLIKGQGVANAIAAIKASLRYSHKEIFPQKQKDFNLPQSYTRSRFGVPVSHDNRVKFAIITLPFGNGAMIYGYTCNCALVMSGGIWISAYVGKFKM